MAAVEPATQLSMTLQEGSLVAGSTAVLGQLPAEATVRQEEGGSHAAVIGFASPGGLSTARADFELGKVYGGCACMSAWEGLGYAGLGCCPAV